MIQWIVLMTTLISTSLASAQMLTSGRWDVHQDDDQKKFAVQLHGTIAAPLADEFENILTRAPEGYLLILDLDSHGGSLREGLKIIGLMRAEKAKRRVITTVDNGQKCGSMCVFLFAEGTRRWAGEVASFMFHGASPVGSNIPDATQTDRLLNLLRDAGVNAIWLQSLMDLEVFSTPGEYWVSGRELVDQNSNLVTHMMPRHKKIRPVQIPFDPNLRSR